MKKLRLVTVFLVLFLVGGLLLLPSVRFPLIGWLKGESFYQGMPTSYWVHDVQTSDMSIAPNGQPYRNRPASVWQDWLSGYLPSYREPATFTSVIESDAGENLRSAVAVLSEMLGHSDPKVRMFATIHFDLICWRRIRDGTWPKGWSEQMFQAAIAPAYAALLKVLDDESGTIRNHAALVLWMMDPDAAKRDGVKPPMPDRAFEEASPPPPPNPKYSGEER